MDDDRIQELVDRPSESLSIEYKGWINPDSIEGVAKIVRTAMAMRNHGGGYIVFGFTDDTSEVDFSNAPPNNETIRIKFHIDKIQGMITKYSSEPFEVKLHYRLKSELKYPLFPIIEIPYGIKTPVAAKADLIKGGNKYLIKANRIYVRTLSANNTPSTAEAIWKDYNKLVEVCFDNREADIGRFLRRHLGGVSPELIQDIAIAITHGLKSDETIEDRLRGLLQESEQRFINEVDKRGLSLPEHGAWEVGLIIIGDIPPYKPNNIFLNLLESSNPNYTGWPIWLDSRNFSDANAKPYVFEGWSSGIDFMRLHSEGKFYQRRALGDDISSNPNRPKAMTSFDFGIPIVRTAEAIAVGLEFAKAMGCEPEKTQLSFAFKWSKLRGRELSSWAWPGRYISPNRSAYQDEVMAISHIQLETPVSAISQFVYNIIKELLMVFDGFDPGFPLVDDFVQRLLERRWF